MTSALAPHWAQLSGSGRAAAAGPASGLGGTGRSGFAVSRGHADVAAQWATLSVTGGGAVSSVARAGGSGSAASGADGRTEASLAAGRGPTARAAARLLRDVLRRPAPQHEGRILRGEKPPAYLRPTGAGRERARAALAKRRALGNARPQPGALSRWSEHAMAEAAETAASRAVMAASLASRAGEF